jgi:hypothetical protein
MGPLPDRKNLPPLDVIVSETFECEEFKRLKLSFAAESNDRIPAYLFIPKDTSPKSFPAMVALHQTVEIGKDEPAGLGGYPSLHYGLELANRGYVVIVPDYPSFGEYAGYDFEADNYVSGSMKGIFNHMRCVDLLCTLPEVDSERIGVIGHSLGGHNAIFVGVFDTRIKVIISSGGWTPFDYYCGGKLDNWAAPLYMPRIRDVYELAPDKVPFDFDGMISALAPRAFFSNSPLRDDMDVNGVKHAMGTVKKAYEAFDAADKLQVLYPDCKHRFPKDVRQQAYQFIDKELKY